MRQSEPLVLENVSASYGAHAILRDLSLSVRPGELVSLLGSSGCGKTTTLRLVAGFLSPISGTIRLGERDISRVPVHKRNIGIVFQNYALLPHLSVRDNVAFGLKQRGLAKPDREKEAMDMLEAVGLDGLADRLPAALSGGQKQRVALARALVIKPPLLMFDEPLSNLDAKLRIDMRVHIRSLQQANERTAIYVTHDQEEAFAISDRVAIMDAGRIVQLDTPEALYRRPANRFVARFVGFENIILMRVVARSERTVTASMRGGTEIRFSRADYGDIPDNFLLAVRPEGLVVSAPEAGDIPATLGVRTYLGRAYQYQCASDAGSLVAHGSVTDGLPRTGSRISLKLMAHQCAILPAEADPGA